VSESRYTCPECGEEFITEEDLRKHLEEEHAYGEDEIERVLHGEPEEEERRTRRPRLLERPRRKIHLGFTPPKSSEILRDILERYEIKEAKIEDIIAEVEDLEEGRDPALGQYVTPAEIMSVLQTFGIKQPKLSYIVNKYTQRVYKILMDLQYRQAALGVMGVPQMNPTMSPFGIPQMPQMSPFNPMLPQHRYNPFMQNPAMQMNNPMSIISQMQMWRQIQRMMEMWEKEEELRLKKLEKEVEAASKGAESKSKSSADEDKIEKLRKEFEEKMEKTREEILKLRDELHKKDLELAKKDFELMLERNRSPDLVSTLKFIETVAPMLGYTRGGSSGLAVVSQQLDRMDKRVGQALDLLREAVLLKRAEKIKEKKERTRRSYEEAQQILSSLDKALSKLEEEKKAKEEFTQAVEKAEETISG